MKVGDQVRMKDAAVQGSTSGIVVDLFVWSTFHEKREPRLYRLGDAMVTYWPFRADGSTYITKLAEEFIVIGEAGEERRQQLVARYDYYMGRRKTHGNR